MEHDEKADALERDVDDMAEQSDRVGDHIGEARSDWEAKEQDDSVPGAQPDPADETPEESDQLPEEAPAEQVQADAGGEARSEATDSPGVPGEEETATGNPDAAGSDR
jgi:hypothetical protein